MSFEIKYYHNNKKESEVFIVNGLREGEYKSYHYTNSDTSNEDLQINIICNYVNGKKHGEERVYDTCEGSNEGQLLEINNYNNGKLHGIRTTYEFDGVLDTITNYINGYKEGEEKVFFDNNQIKELNYYKNGKLHGLCKYYYKSTSNCIGLLQNETNYEEGYRHGECKSYDKNGRLEELSNFENDCIVGDYYKYKNGILETKCEYYKDEYMGESLVGDYINYYCSDSDDDGKIKNICTYEDGAKNGEYREYYNNGILKTLGNYTHNCKQGFEYRYDETGNLIDKVFINEYESNSESNESESNESNESESNDSEYDESESDSDSN
jgi:antitoxin component YwqK of YwqJK toxin-antitoxin module